MEGNINYDKLIQIASWVAMGGLIISAIGVFAFRHYTNKKNSATNRAASNERQEISTKLDTEFENTKKEITQKKDSIIFKLNTSFENVEQQISEESNKYLNSLKTLNKDIETAHKSLKGQISSFQNLVDFNGFNISMTLEASSMEGIEYLLSGLYGTTTINFEFSQKVESKSINVVAQISEVPTMTSIEHSSFIFEPTQRIFFLKNLKFKVVSVEGDLEGLQIDKAITLSVKPGFSPKELSYFELSYGQGKVFKITSRDGVVSSNIKQELIQNEPHNYLKLELNN